MTDIDIKMTPDQNGVYDFSIEDNKIVMDETYESLIFSALFTDKRAEPSQVIDPRLRRGWTGDLTEISARKVGSWLWLLEQERLTQNTLNRAIDYCKDALKFMIDDGIANFIEVEGEIIAQTGLSISIVVTLASYESEIFNFIIKI